MCADLSARRWLEPMLVVPDWSAVTAELRDALAAWTCAAADPSFADDAWLVGGTIETGYIEPTEDWCLHLVSRFGLNILPE